MTRPPPTASDGNSLFLPAPGYRWNDELYFAGLYCHYWSSSLRTDGPDYSWGFFFNSDYYLIRYFGLSVRAVRSAPN